MFPAEKFPSFPCEFNPEIFNSRDENAIESKIAFSHSIGLFQQLIELLKLSNLIFTDISKSFDDLNLQFQNLQSHLKEFKSKANQILSSTENFDPNSFMSNDYEIKSSTSNVKCTPISFSDEQSNFNNLILSNLASDPIFASGNGQIDFNKLEQNASDISRLENKLKSKLDQETKVEAVDKATQNSENEEIKEENKPQSDIKLNHIHSSIQQPFLLHPPPRGQTQNWQKSAQITQNIKS